MKTRTLERAMKTLTYYGLFLSTLIAQSSYAQQSPAATNGND